ILDHIEELNELDTAGVEPMSGGVGTANVLRDDETDATLLGKGRGAFPETEGDYLKVPPVFE
ncbi:MAG: aspartyl/glutamyl-tRNA amidotransferase subunit C, partial [Candidatus Colwellbacteria bacterium]|nr:aspartyl/glutamyl-tRNA amidotransferase subunit C [Candidatus Colwellbacteria bacterium]